MYDLFFNDIGLREILSKITCLTAKQGTYSDYLADPCKTQVDHEVDLHVKARTPRMRPHHAQTRPHKYHHSPHLCLTVRSPRGLLYETSRDQGKCACQYPNTSAKDEPCTNPTTQLTSAAHWPYLCGRVRAQFVLGRGVRVLTSTFTLVSACFLQESARWPNRQTQVRPLCSWLPGKRHVVGTYFQYVEWARLITLLEDYWIWIFSGLLVVGYCTEQSVGTLERQFTGIIELFTWQHIYSAEHVASSELNAF